MNPVYSNGESQSSGTRKLKVLVIDTRICLLDSLSQAIGNHPDIETVKASCIAEYRARQQSQLDCAKVGNGAHASGDELQSIDLILYSIGVNSQSLVMQDIATLSGKFDGVSVVLVSERMESWIAKLIADKHVNGVVSASYNASQLVHCLRLIDSGVNFLPAEYLSLQANNSGAVADEKLSPRLDKKLTPRQREVLQYVLLGKSNKYIAAELSLCESTIKVHVHEVMKRLGATSRTHASYIVNNQYRASVASEPEVPMPAVV